MKILIKYKTVYGNEYFYPVNDLAHLMCELLGQKTLTRQDIATLKKQFIVELAQETINL